MTRSSARCTAATARRSAPRRSRPSSTRSRARPTPASAAAAAARTTRRTAQLATEANIDYLGDYVRSPDGNLYLHNGLNRNDIFRISRDGKIYLFAGNGSKDRAMTGDGGPAKDAGLGIVSALAAAPDGSLLIASYSDDNYAKVIRRVSPDGSKIETIAGNATARTAPLGDGKPALEAHIGQVNDMTVAPDGTIYWVERYSATNG